MSNLRFGRVNMGVYGCIWVFMGAVGFTNTNAQANNTERDRNGVAGYDSPKRT